MKSLCRSFYTCGVLIVVITALLFALTITRHYSRAGFIEFQSLTKDKDQLKLDWRRMQLERATYKAQGRIDGIVWDRLKMRSPKEKDIHRIAIDG